jgi:hypothetical protein
MEIVASSEFIDSISNRLPYFEKQVLHQLLNSRNEELYETLQKYDPTVEKKIKSMICRIVVTKSLDILYTLWNNIFLDLSTEKAKIIAKSGTGDQPAPQSLSLVYGEIDFFSFANILERVNPQHNEVFVDLGHGTGKALLCASLLYGPTISKSFGIELIPTLTSKSEEVLISYNHAIQNNDLFQSHLNCKVEVAQGDFLQEELLHWTDADIVFANSTCFDDSLMISLAGVASRMKKGSRFITLTKQLPSEDFRLIDRRQYNMSWGEATCFTLVRI